jgi:peroxin-12
LYGLRRKSARLRLRKDSARKDSSEEVQHSGLEKRQRILSVVFLVVLPYFKSKLHAIYNKEREARLRESLWGAEDQGFDEADFFTGDDSIVSREPSGNEELSVRVQLATKIKKFIAVCYPWIHASSEGLSFTYQLLYLLDATGFYSLGLQALGIQVCRATGQELMDTSSRISKIRNHERERLRGPPWLKTVQGALLSCSYAVLDYAQTGLIAAVFIFKMMEWWYQSAEERLSAPTVYPPPPPPPAPKVINQVALSETYVNITQSTLSKFLFFCNRWPKKESLYLQTDPSVLYACKNVQIHQLSLSLDLFSAILAYLSMFQSTSDVR